MGDSIGKEDPELIWVHDNLPPPAMVTDQVADVGGDPEEMHLLSVLEARKKPKHCGTCWEDGCPRRSKPSYCLFPFSSGGQSFV